MSLFKVLHNSITSNKELREIHTLLHKDLFNRAILEGMKDLWAVPCTSVLVVTTCGCRCSTNWWFDPRLPAACGSVLGKDTEPQIAPVGCSIGVYMLYNIVGRFGQELFTPSVVVCGDIDFDSDPTVMCVSHFLSISS